MERNATTTPMACKFVLRDALIGVRAGWEAWHDLQRRHGRVDTPRELFDRHFAGLKGTSALPARPEAAAVGVKKTTTRSRSGPAGQLVTTAIPSALFGTVMALSVCAADADDTGAVAQVRTMATEDRPATSVEDASAWLRVDADGVTMTMDTADLVPGNVTTAWWVIVTAPDRCLANPCAPKEIIERAAKIGTQISYADGAVNGPDGRTQFTGYLPKGQVAGGWFQTAFDHPLTAEIHLVLNDHGPLIPELAASMLTTYRGGCRDDSLPPPFPASAKADGLPGPNACQLIQAAIFLPGGKPAGMY